MDLSATSQPETSLSATPLAASMAAMAAPVPAAEPDEAAAATGITAAERVLASELQARGHSQDDALAMMVSSVVRMVQAGKARSSRWKAS